MKEIIKKYKAKFYNPDYKVYQEIDSNNIKISGELTILSFWNYIKSKYPEVRDVYFTAYLTEFKPVSITKCDIEFNFK